jgi:hypothetical protein
VSLPQPIPGLVIRYSYLWRSELLQGRDEGVKDRPCAIILVMESVDGGQIVTVLPITHSQPVDETLALEIPITVKRRLGLDGERSWIMFGEANRFLWPGPDLRPLPGQDISTVGYGILPPKLFEVLKQRLLKAAQVRRTHIVPRTN